MKKVFMLFALLLMATLTTAQPPMAAQTIAFIGVTVIDATGAAAKSDQTVVIAEGKISAIGKTGKVKLPKGAHVIEARGKFLIPGLWDMHVHAWNKQTFFPMFIANGVTGVRDMFGGLAQIKLWQKEIAEGKTLGPRIFAAGQIVDGPKPVWPGSIAVKDEAEGREAVKKVKSDGSDFVKVYSLLPRDAFFAIADEAKKQGLPFAGHVPHSVSAAEASDAGIKSIEHLERVLLGCSSNEEEIRKESDRLTTSQRKKILETYDDKKAQALFARFAKNGTWQSPTLVVLRALGNLDNEGFTNDPRQKYLPVFITNSWNPKTDFRFRNMTSESYASHRAMFEKHLEIIAKMRRAGVEFLAGTDTPNPYCFPGFSLHDELALLVKAGLTPMEALQAATRNPAKYLGLLDSLGTVEKGKLADLVLLDANPLADIANTQRIHSVVVNGRLVTQAEIQEMLARLQAASGRK